MSDLFKKSISGFVTLFIAILTQLSFAQDITVAIPDTSFQNGSVSKVELPISTTSITFAQNVLNYTLTIDYNPSIVVFDTVSTIGTISTSASNISVTPPIPTGVNSEQVTVSATFSSALVGSGILLNTSFDLVANTGNTLLDLESTFNSGLVNSISIDGNLEIFNEPILSLPILDFSLIEDASDSLLFDLDNHFSDLDNDVLSFQVQNSNLNLIQHSINGNNEFTVSLSSDSSGIAIFIITATDTDGIVSDTFAVSVSPENDAPFVTNTISNQNFQEDSGTHLIVNNLDNIFSDIDSPSLIFSTSVNGSGITPSVNSNSLFISTVQDSFGVYLVNVTANDGQDSVSTSFSITINSVNDKPFVTNPYGSTTILEEDSVTLGNLSNNFGDVEDQTLSYSFLNKNSASIQVSLIGQQPKIKPIPNYFNTIPDTVIFIAQDSGGLTENDTLLVNITNVNDLPIKIGFMQDAIVNEDSPPFALENLNTIFTDIDDVLNFSVFVDTSGISVNFSNGFPIVTLTEHYFNEEPDTLIFTATDSFGETVNDTISLTVLPLNDPPLVGNQFSLITVFEDEYTNSQLTFNLDDFFQSPDGDTLEFSFFENSGNFSVNLQGVLQNIVTISLVSDSFNTVDVLNPNSENIIFAATDKDLQTVTDTLELIILAVNDPPRASYQNIQVIGNTQSVINTSPFVVAPLNDQNIGFRDIEGNAIDVTSYTVSSSAPNIAYVEIVNDTSQTGQINYIPKITVNSTPPIQYGNVTFTFTAAELATGLTGSDTFVLTVYDPDPVVVGPVIELLDAQLTDGTTGVFYASQGAFGATVTETGNIDVFQNSVTINYYSPITNTVPLQTVLPSYTVTNGNGQNEIIAITDTFSVIDPTITEFKAEVIAFNVIGDSSSNSRNYIIDRNIPNLNATVTPTQIPFLVGLNASVNVSATFNDSTGSGVGAGIDTTFARVNLLTPSGSNTLIIPTVNGSPNSTCTFNTSISGFSEVGTYTIILSVRDRVGNVKSTTKEVIVKSTEALIGTIGQGNFNYFNPEDANSIDFTVRQLTSLPISLKPLEIDQFSVSNVLVNTLTKSPTLSSSTVLGDSTFYNFTANFPSGTFDSTATFLDVKVTVVNLQDSLLTTANRNFILDRKSPILTSVTTDLGSPVSITKGQSISLIINFSDPTIGGFQGSLPVTNNALTQVIRPDGSIISPNFNFASNSSGQAQFNQTQLPGSYNLRVVMEDNVGNVLDSTHVALFTVNGTAPIVLIPTTADFNNFLNPNPPNILSFTVTGIDTGTTPILVNARVLNASNLNVLSIMNAVTLNSISDSTITFNSGGITSSIDSIRFEVTATNDLGLSNLVFQNYNVDSQSPSILSFSTDTTIIKLGEQLLFSGNLSETVLGSGIDQTSIEIEILAPDGSVSSLFPPTTGNDFNKSFSNFPFNGATLAGNYTSTLTVNDNVGNSNQTNTNFFVNDDSLQIQFLPADFGFFFNPTGIDSFSLNAIKLGTSSIATISGSVYNANDVSQVFVSNTESFSANSNTTIPFSLSTNIPLGISDVIFEATVTNLLGNSVTRSQAFTSDQEIPTLVTFDIQPNPIFVSQSVQISASMLDTISGLDTTSFELQIIAPAPSGATFNFTLSPQANLVSSNSVFTTFATNNVSGIYNVSFSFDDNVGNTQTFSTTYQVDNTPAPLVSLNASDYLNFVNPAPPNPLSITVSEQVGISLPNTGGVSYTVLGQPSGTILNSISPNYTASDTIHQILAELNLTNLPQTDTEIDISVTATNVLGFSNTQLETYILDSQGPVVTNFLATPDSVEIDSLTIISASFSDSGSGLDSVLVSVSKNGSSASSTIFSGTQALFNTSQITFSTNNPGTYTLTLDLRDNVGNETSTTTILEVSAEPHQIAFLEKDFQNYFLPTQSDSFSFVISKPLNQAVNLKSKTNGGVQINVFDAQTNNLIENIPTNSFSNYDHLASVIPITFGLSSPLNSSVALIRVEVTTTNVLNDVAFQTQNYRPDFFAPTFTNFSPANSSIAIGDTTDILLNNLTDPNSNGILGSGVDSVEVISKKIGTLNANILFSGKNSQFVNSTTSFTTQVAGTYELFLRVTDNVGNVNRDTTQFVVNANPPQINFASSEFGDYFKPQTSNNFNLSVSEIDNIAFNKLTIRVFNNANGLSIQNPIVFTPPDTATVYNFSYSISGLNDSTVNEIRVEAEAINVLNDTSTVSKIYLPDFHAPLVNTFAVSQSSISIGDTTDVLGNFVDFVSGSVVGSGVDTVFVRVKKVGNQTTSTIFSGTNAQFVNSTTIFTTQIAGNYQLFLRVTDNVGNVNRDTTQFVVNANPPQINFASSEFGDYFKPQTSNNFNLSVSEIDNIAFNKLTIRVFNNANGLSIQNPIVFTPPDTATVYNFSYSISGLNDSTVNEIRVEAEAINVLNDTSTVSKIYLPDFHAPLVNTFAVSQSSISIGDTTDVLGNFVDFVSGSVVGSGVDTVFVRVKKVGNQTTSTIFSGTNAQFVNSTTIFTTQIAGNYQLFLRVTDNVGNVNRDTTQFVVNAEPHTVEFSESEFGNFFNPSPPNIFSFSVIQPQNVLLKPQTQQGIQIRVLETANGNILEDTFVPNYSVSDTIDIAYSFGTVLDTSVTEITLEVLAINVLNDSTLTSTNFVPDYFVPEISLLSISADTVGINENLTLSANFDDSISGISLSEFVIVRPSPLGSLNFTSNNQNNFQVIFDSTTVAGNYTVNFSVTDNVGNLVSQQAQFFVKSSPPEITFGGAEFNNFFNPNPPNLLNFTVIQKDEIPVQATNGISISIFGKPSGNLIFGPFQPSYVVNDTIQISTNVTLNIPQNDEAIDVKVIATNEIGISEMTTETFLIDGVKPSVTLLSPQVGEEFAKNSNFNFIANYTDEIPIGLRLSKNEILKMVKKSNSKISELLGAGVDLSSVSLVITSPDGLKTDVTSLTNITATGIDFISSQLTLVGNYLIELKVADNVGNLNTIVTQIKVLEEKPVLNFQTSQFGDFFNPASPNSFTVLLIENGSTQFTPSNIKINVSRVVESGIIPGSTNIPFDFNRNGNEVEVSFLPSLTFATSDIGMKVDFILNHPLFTPDTLSKIYSIDNISPEVSANSPEPNEEFIQDSQVNIFFSFDDSQTSVFSTKPNGKSRFAKTKREQTTSRKSQNKILGNGSGIDTSSVVFRLEFPDGHQEVRNGLVTPNSFSLTTEPLNTPGNYAAILVLADNVGNTKLLNQKFKINKRVLPTTVPQIKFDAPFTFGSNPHNFNFLTYDDEGISTVTLKISRLRATFENPEGVLEVIEESAEFDQTTQNDTVFVNYLAQFSLSNTSSAKDLEVVLEASITDFEGNLKIFTQSYKIDQDSPVITQITPTNNTLIESLTNFSVRVDFEDIGIGIESSELEVVDSEGIQIQKVQGTIQESASVGFAEIFISESLKADNYQVIFTASDSLGNSTRQVTTFRVNSSLFVVEDIHNYPNPFKIGSTTTFVFTATKDALVTIHIYDFLGRKVRTLLEEREFRPQGNEIEIVPVWDGKDDSGSNLAKGVYFANVLVKEKNGEGKSKKVVKIALIK
ncbi:MAG: hypothetical protein DWQ06_02980 [Calditrichaeota bacterium]|nr:MAG: hypothetical protein DWQ06_02980 [Calditrichota bacterium]